MAIDINDIYQLAATIWGATLGLKIEPDQGVAVVARSRVAACIQITGAWNGAILLDCSSDVARRAASVMFNTPVEDVTLGDLQDGVAELVNMIGGNIKALLPETCYLSLPAVVEGGDYSARVLGSRLVSRVPFVSGGEAVTISLLEKVSEQSTASPTKAA